MLKTDEHMEKIRQKLLDEQAGIKASDNAKRQRELKKFGKQVQVNKLREREKSKRDLDDKVKAFKKSGPPFLLALLRRSLPASQLTVLSLLNLPQSARTTPEQMGTTISRLTSTTRGPTSAQRPAATLAAPGAVEGVHEAAVAGLARRAISATPSSGGRRRAGGRRRTTASRQTCLAVAAAGDEVELGEDVAGAEAACEAGEAGDEAEERQSRVWARAGGASAPARRLGCPFEGQRFSAVA